MNLYHPNYMNTIMKISQQLLDGYSFSEVYVDEVFNKNNVLLFWKDARSYFLGCNMRFASVAGFDQIHQILGKNDFELPWRKEQTVGFRNDDQTVLTLNCPLLNKEEKLSQLDGKYKIMSTNKFPIYSSNGERRGVLGILIEITEYKILQQTISNYCLGKISKRLVL